MRFHAWSFFACVLLTSCGGSGSGGGGGSSSSGNGRLIISEVSTCYYYDVDCWLEVYNPSSSSVNLASYQLKSTSVDTTTGGSVVITNFNLPSIQLGGYSYAVISGNTGNLAQRNDQNVRLRTGNIVPFWTANGFIELVRSSATADFVRFGTSSQTPTTGSAWSGSSVAALPYSSADYGKSIVRLYTSIDTTDTNTATDWTQVSWATPGGRNDVLASAVDADADGIPDSAETSGGTFAGLDLYTMGARTSQKDIFIEVDYMNSSDVGVIPRSASLQKVVDAFSAQSIQVHFDAGTLFSAAFSTSSFNLGQGSNVVTYEPCVTMDQTTCASNTSSRRSIYDWKEEAMDIRRRNVFHYLLMGYSQNANGSSGSSGLAELPGNDLIVSMGNWGFSTSTASSLNQLVNMQASTVMHELGHNLGLYHGGNESTNYKPNYWSVMNYTYQLYGLESSATTSTAYQRWRFTKGDSTVNGSSTDYCTFVNSPCGSTSQFVMSYSNGSSSSLTESALSETSNIGRGNSGGTTYADWDLSGALTGGTVSKDLNGDSTLGTLSDYNDWGNLTYPFVRAYQGNTGASLQVSKETAVPSPMNDDRQPVASELAPPAHILDRIRHVR